MGHGASASIDTGRMTVQGHLPGEAGHGQRLVHGAAQVVAHAVPWIDHHADAARATWASAAPEARDEAPRGAYVYAGGAAVTDSRRACADGST